MVKSSVSWNEALYQILRIKTSNIFKWFKRFSNNKDKVQLTTAVDVSLLTQRLYLAVEEVSKHNQNEFGCLSGARHWQLIISFAVRSIEIQHVLSTLNGEKLPQKPFVQSDLVHNHPTVGYLFIVYSWASGAPRRHERLSFIYCFFVFFGSNFFDGNRPSARPAEKDQQFDLPSSIGFNRSIIVLRWYIVFSSGPAASPRTDRFKLGLHLFALRPIGGKTNKSN